MLSAQLTRARITSEARALVRCVRNGVRVPDVRLVDLESGIIAMEWIDGKSIRFLLGDDEDEGTESAKDDQRLDTYGISQGKPSYYFELALRISRATNVDDRPDACANAQSRYHPQRSHHIKHDAYPK